MPDLLFYTVHTYVVVVVVNMKINISKYESRLTLNHYNQLFSINFVVTCRLGKYNEEQPVDIRTGISGLYYTFKFIVI